MKKLLFIMLLFGYWNLHAQQFSNGDFLTGGSPNSADRLSGGCNTLTGMSSWGWGNTNATMPQLTVFSNGSNQYIDLTPCGSTGNGAWIEQKISFGDRITCDSMYISFDLRPMAGGSNSYDAGVIVTMDGIPIGARVFSADASKWVNKVTAAFKATPGSHVFRFTGQSNAGDRTPAVMGIDNIQLHAAAKPSFKIVVNGVARDVPTDGSAVEVPCDNIILDLSGLMPCATNYNIHVQESDQYWNRTMAYEWGSWFNTPISGPVNIQQLATSSAGMGANYIGTDRTREGKKLIAGKLPNGKDRYYRIGVCTGQPAWDCKFVLIKVIPGPALDKKYSRFSIETSAPDVAGNYTVNVKAIAQPADCGFYWEVNEIDANGNPVPGTQGQNLPAWWANPLQTNFPGYANGTTAGKFNISKRYKITRGTWCDCKAWDQSSVIVQYNNERKAVLSNLLNQ